MLKPSCSSSAKFAFQIDAATLENRSAYASGYRRVRFQTDSTSLHAALDPFASTFPGTEMRSIFLCTVNPANTCDADQCEKMVRHSPFGSQRSVVARPTTDAPNLSVAVLRIRLSPSRGIAYLRRSHRGAISRRDPRRLSRPRAALERKMVIRVRQCDVVLDSCCGHGHIRHRPSTVILTRQ